MALRRTPSARLTRFRTTDSRALQVSSDLGVLALIQHSRAQRLQLVAFQPQGELPHQIGLGGDLFDSLEIAIVEHHRPHRQPPTRAIIDPALAMAVDQQVPRRDEQPGDRNRRHRTLRIPDERQQRRERLGQQIGGQLGLLHTPCKERQDDRVMAPVDDLEHLAATVPSFLEQLPISLRIGMSMRWIDRHVPS
jgi:hypothetical protein